jgi:hypothetical protein
LWNSTRPGGRHFQHRYLARNAHLGLARKLALSKFLIRNPKMAVSSISISSTTHPSQIFRLPLEIRRIIYGFVFGERDVDVQRRSGSFHACEPYFEFIKCPNVRFKSQTPRLQNLRAKPSPLAIAATCQQFYHETVKVWYANVRF